MATETNSIDLSGIDIDLSDLDAGLDSSPAIDLSDISVDLSDLDIDLSPEPQAKPTAAPSQEVKEEGWGDVLSKTLQNVPNRLQRGFNATIQDIQDRFGRASGESRYAGSELAESFRQSPNSKGLRDEISRFGVNPDDLLADYNTPQYQQAENALREGVRTEIVESSPEMLELKQEAEQLTQQIEETAPVTDKWSAKGITSAILGAGVEMLPAIGATLVTKKPMIGSGAFTSQAYGMYLADGQDKGLSRQDARDRAQLMAAFEGVSEAIPLGLLIKSGTGRLSNVGRGALQEGTQEMFVEAANIGYDTGVLNEDMTLGEAIENIFYSGIVGAGVGAPMGAMSPVDRGQQPTPEATAAESAAPETAPVEGEYSAEAVETDMLDDFAAPEVASEGDNLSDVTQDALDIAAEPAPVVDTDPLTEAVADTVVDEAIDQAVEAPQEVVIPEIDTAAIEADVEATPELTPKETMQKSAERFEQSQPLMSETNAKIKEIYAKDFTEKVRSEFPNATDAQIEMLAQGEQARAVQPYLDKVSDIVDYQGGKIDKAPDPVVEPTQEITTEVTPEPVIEPVAEPAAEVTPEPAPEFDLQQETEAERQQRETDQAQQQEVQQKAEAEAVQKTVADLEVDDFVLEGSDRPADVESARGQQDLLVETRGETEAKKEVEPVKKQEVKPEKPAVIEPVAEDVKTAKVPQALEQTDSSKYLKNKSYRESLRGMRDLAIEASPTKEVNTKVDTLAEATQKLGGISRDVAKSEGLDPAAFKRNKLFPAKKGMTFDQAAELLNEKGYRNRNNKPLDANDVLDLITDDVNNNQQTYSTDIDPAMINENATMMREWSKEMGGADKLNNAITKALQGKPLGRKQAAVVDEMLGVINATRTEQVPQALETLEARRKERREAERTDFNEIMEDSTGNDNYVADVDAYDTMMQDMPDNYDHADAALESLVTEAYGKDAFSADEILNNLESGSITEAQATQQLESLVKGETDVKVTEDVRSEEQRTDTDRVEERQEAKPKKQATEKPLAKIEKDNLQSKREEYAEDELYMSREDYDSDSEFNDAIQESINDQFYEQTDYADIDSKEDVKAVNELLDTLESIGMKPDDQVEVARWRKAMPKPEVKQVDVTPDDTPEPAGDREGAQISMLAQEIPYLESLAETETNPMIKRRIDKEVAEYREQLDYLRSGMTIEQVKSQMGYGSEVDTTVLGFPSQKAKIEKDFGESGDRVPYNDAVDAVKEFTDEYKGTKEIDFTIAQTESELTFDVPKGRKILAYYNPNDVQVAIVASNFKSKEQIKQVLQHELVVHHGLRQLLDQSSYDMQMDRLLRAEGRNKELSKVFSEVRDVYKDQIDTTSKDGERIVAEEVLARIAEDVDLNQKTKVIRKIVNSIKRMLSRVGILNDSATYQDAVDLIRSNAEGLRARVKSTGKPRKGTPDMSYQPPEGMAALSREQTIENANVPDDIKQDMRDVQGEAESPTLADTIKAAFTDSKYKAAQIKQHISDEFAVLEYYEKSANEGALQDASESAYKMASQSKAVDSVVSAVMNNGHPVWKDGGVTIKPDTKGFAEIFEPIANLEGNMLKVWEQWAGALRAERLLKEGREKLYTAESIKRIKDFVNSDPKIKKAFNQAHKDWRDLNNSVLDFSQEAGLISPEQRKIWARDDYVPFYRQAPDAITGPQGAKGLAGVSAGIRRLKGGTGRLNILENMTQNIAYQVNNSYKNMAMQRIVNLTEGAAMEKQPMQWKVTSVQTQQAEKALKDIGIEFDELTSAQRKQYSDMFTMAAPAGKDIVSVMVNGKREYYKVTDDALLRSVSNMGPTQLSVIETIMGFPKRLLTDLTTGTPAFAVRSFVRDTFEVQTGMMKAAGTTKTDIAKDFLGGRMWTTAIKGYADSFKQNQTYWDIMGSAGMNGEYYATKPENVRKQVEKLRRRNTTLDTPQKVHNAYKNFLQASEMANRMAVYERVLKNGGTQAEAAYQSLDVINFSRRGDGAIPRFLISTVPFLNARIQGLDRLYRGTRDNPAAVALKGAILFAGTAALMALNDDREEYWAIPEWERDMFWHVWFDDVHYRIPKPFEVGAITATIPERIYEAATREEKVFLKRMNNVFLETFSLNPLPQAISPIIEQLANESFFFGRSIVSPGLQYLPPKEQFTVFTSELAKATAQSMPDAAPEWLKSPVRVEALIRGYFGSVGGFVLETTQSAYQMQPNVPAGPTKSIDQYPVVGTFIREQERTNKYVGRVYEIAKEANQANQQIKALIDQEKIKEARAVKKEKGSLLQIRKRLNRTTKQFSELNKQQKAIYQNRVMSPDQKRKRLDQITKQKNELAKQVAERYWRYL